MLIWLDSTVLDADLETDASAIQGINSIFSSVYRGEHYALAPRKVLQVLSKSEFLSISVRAVIQKVLSEYSTITSLASTLGSRVVVTYGKATCCTKAASGSWEIPVGLLGLVGTTKGVLICENLNDFKLFMHAARQYKAIEKLPGEIMLEGYGGGGSTTPDCLENVVNVERRWGMCIVDSDRLCPGQLPDLTAAKCYAISQNTTVVARFVDVLFREAENVIPLVFISEVIPPTHSHLWDRHLKSAYVVRADSHEFADLKRGLALEKVFTYSVGSPARTFWSGVANDIFSAGDLPGDCLIQGYCIQSVNSKSCNCLLISGYGEKLLELVVRVLSERSVHKSVELAKNDQNSAAWFRIGREVFEWGCAPLRMRA